MWRKVEFCNTKWDTQARGHFRTTNTSRRCGKFWKLCWINTHVLCNVQILKSAVFAVSQYFVTKKLLGGIAPLLVQSLHHLGVILPVVAAAAAAWLRDQSVASSRHPPHPSPRLRWLVKSTNMFSCRGQLRPQWAGLMMVTGDSAPKCIVT